MTNFKTSDFDYYLPQELIAQTPSDKRDCSKLMVLHRDLKKIEHKLFKDIIDYLNPGDLLVLNDTKVMPANIVGKKADGSARIEVLLVKRWEGRGAGIGLGEGFEQWICLVKPGKRVKAQSYIIFSDYLKGKVLEKMESGEQVIEFEGDLKRFLREKGELPLPPYIMSNVQCPISNECRILKSELGKRYQTIYAAKEGASAAPTAGLHFTPELLEEIKAKGVSITKITLHTGLGTFKPVYAEYIKDHKMFDEEFEVSVETLSAIKKAKRVIAVGTTSVRTLETLAMRNLLDSAENVAGSTDIFIYPGFKFKVIDAMITNFHIPQSTLLMLVSAFAGKDFIFEAYKKAIDEKYRFFSFGDAMLIV